MKNLILIAFLLPSVASAQFAYDESTDGDLSDDPNAPTLIVSSETTITVAFTTDREGLDRDIYTVEVPSGYELSGIILDDYNSNYPENLGFVGFSSGSVLDANPILPTAAGFRPLDAGRRPDDGRAGGQGRRRCGAPHRPPLAHAPARR